MAVDFNSAIYGKKYSTLITDSLVSQEAKCNNRHICSIQSRKKIPGGLAGRISAISGMSTSFSFESLQIEEKIQAYEASVRLNREGAFLIEYTDSDKVFLCVPLQSKQVGRAQFLAFRTDVVNSTAYLIEWLFSDQAGSYGAGELSFYHLDSTKDVGNTSNITRLASVMVETGGGVHLRLTWTHHGGFPSWSDCFKHHSSETWAIIGYVVSPGATLVGIGLGCL